jgi:GntR family transcriptional regulator/MocR family aminotransferase
LNSYEPISAAKPSPDFNFLACLNGKATYRSLIDAIADAIDVGLLTDGDRMPGSRELAQHVGTSRSTVTRAFDALIARGYLIGNRGSGTVVAAKHRPAQREIVLATKSGSFSWEETFSPTAIRLLSAEQSLNMSGDFKQLNYGALPEDMLPLNEWRRIVYNLSKQFNGNDLSDDAGTRDVFGCQTLRQAISGFLHRTRGIVCSAGQIVLYSGTQNALGDIARLLVNPGDVAVLERPGYVGAREQLRIHGADVFDVDVDQAGLIVEQVPSMLKERQAKWLYVTPDGQDPTGSVMSEERRLKLLRLASANGAALIEDAWNAEFQYAGPKLPPLYSLDRSGAVIYLYTFWRLLHPLTSVSCIVLPEQLVPLFKRAKHLSDRQYPMVEHYVLAELIASGCLEEHMRCVWKQLRKQRQALIFAFSQAFKNRVSIAPAQSGLHLLVNFDISFIAEEIEKSAVQAGVPLIATEAYYACNPVSNQFMIDFSSILECESAPRVERMFQGLQDADGVPSKLSGKDMHLKA